jgi:hypothetical protein
MLDPETLVKSGWQYGGGRLVGKSRPAGLTLWNIISMTEDVSCYGSANA